MNDYRHHVCGFFANRADAERVLSLLLGRGLPRERLYLLDAEAVKAVPEPKEDSNAVLKDVLVYGAIGTAVGTGLGALAQVALVAGSTTLFIASPLLAPLAMMGWGASIGAIVGAGVGATAGGGDKVGPLGDLFMTRSSVARWCWWLRRAASTRPPSPGRSSATRWATTPTSSRKDRIRPGAQGILRQADPSLPARPTSQQARLVRACCIAAPARTADKLPLASSLRRAHSAGKPTQEPDF